MKNPAETDLPKGAPAWATQPIRDLVDQVERQLDLIGVCMSGVSVLRGMPRVVQAIAQVELASDRHKFVLQRAEREAGLARREVDEGFPLLLSQATIALWSTLESSARLVAARWLQNRPDAMQVDPILKLRVKIGEYESLEGEDRCFYILDRLEAEMTAPLKAGVSRFESVFEPLGLGGRVDPAVKKLLLELHQVRNVLVHRRGICDRRLMEACPWLRLSSGDPVKISRDSLNLYATAVMDYGIEIVARLGEKYGVSMKEHRSGLLLRLSKRKHAKRANLESSVSAQPDTGTPVEQARIEQER